jgi:hypothetical protein
MVPLRPAFHRTGGAVPVRGQAQPVQPIARCDDLAICWAGPPHAQSAADKAGRPYPELEAARSLTTSSRHPPGTANTCTFVKGRRISRYSQVIVCQPETCKSSRLSITSMVLLLVPSPFACHLDCLPIIYECSCWRGPGSGGLGHCPSRTMISATP